MTMEGQIPSSPEEERVVDVVPEDERPAEISATEIQQPSVESEADRDRIIQDIETELLKKFSGENTLEQVEQWRELENHTFDEHGFYRMVDENGFRDFLENGIVRSSPTGTDSHIVGKIDIGHRPTSFPSFNKGSPDFSYAREGSDNYIFESAIPMYRRGDKHPTTSSRITGRHWAYRPIDQTTGSVVTEMTADMIKNIFKLGKDGTLHIRSK